jgi:hypothetical protein
MSQIPWNDLFPRVDGLAPIESDNGPYFGQRPKADRQKGIDYSEIHPSSPLKTYRRAAKLWKSFERRVSGLGRLSDNLAGWHIVLDPGHGGIDPGTIVPTVDGAGRKLYVVEDEYVYDITLRAYVLLRLHGARVDITLLSPNHLIRHTTPPAQTFVHEMNEVFNSYTYNRRNRPGAWPSVSVSPRRPSRALRKSARSSCPSTPTSMRVPRTGPSCFTTRAVAAATRRLAPSPRRSCRRWAPAPAHGGSRWRFCVTTQPV